MFFLAESTTLHRAVYNITTGIMITKAKEIGDQMGMRQWQETILDNLSKFYPVVQSTASFCHLFISLNLDIVMGKGKGEKWFFTSGFSVGKIRKFKMNSNVN